MTSGEDKAVSSFMFSEPGEISMDSIKIQVIFSGVNKESLNMTGKVLQNGKLKIPISRVGSWIFHILRTQDDIDRLIDTGGPTMAFLFALYKSYPDLTAWVCNPENCSIVIDVEKQDKANILKEIVGRMKQEVQKYLSEIKNMNLKINIIKILTETPPKKKAESAIGRAAPIAEENQKSDSVAEIDWEYIQLKSESKSTENIKERMIKLLKFAICACARKKYDEVKDAMTAMKEIFGKVKLYEHELISLLQDIEKLHQQLYESSKFLESIELIFASAELLKNLGNQENRLEYMNSYSTSICESIAKVFAVKTTCISVKICAEDEIGISSTKIENSGTKYDLACQAQHRGKQAMKALNFSEVLRFYDVAINLLPREMQYHLDKAEVFLLKNELEKCKAECNKALDLEGSNINKARACTLLAEANLRTCHFHDVIVFYEYSKKLHPNQVVSDKLQILVIELRKAISNQELRNTLSIQQYLFNPPFFM